VWQFASVLLVLIYNHTPTTKDIKVTQQSPDVVHKHHSHIKPKAGESQPLLEVIKIQQNAGTCEVG
jgi:hypothetical protein